MNDVEATIARIKKHRGVQSVIISNKDGVPIRPAKGVDENVSRQLAAILGDLTSKARSVVRELDPQDDLTFLRIRTSKQEFMIAPDKEYTLIVTQNPSDPASN